MLFLGDFTRLSSISHRISVNSSIGNIFQAHQSNGPGRLDEYSLRPHKKRLVESALCSGWSVVPSFSSYSLIGGELFSVMVHI